MNIRKRAAALLSVPLALALLFAAGCSRRQKERPPQPPRTVSLAEVYITGAWKDFIKVEPGDYVLEESGGLFASATISPRLTLLKPFTGRMDDPAATLRLIPLSPAGSELGETFTVKSKEKFNDFVRGGAGDSAAITFSATLFSSDLGWFGKIAGFDGKTVDPPAPSASGGSGGQSAGGTAAASPAPANAPLNTDTDPAFNPRTAARVGRRIVAVPEFTTTQSISEDMILGVTGIATTGLSENKDINRVIDYTQIALIMKQHQFEASDWSNPAKYAEIGKALNVDTIAVGAISLGKKGRVFGQEYVVSVRLIDISTMAIAGSFSFTNTEGMFSDIAESAKRMKVTQ